ncbi:hypothetical protein Vretifemale_18950 [Volvox reticuliferus]|uniref:Uncharacterized protein n=1 Tax=Volvox reticuliferus TaxID=1737510 RepID=A0A8J4D1X2_9CHLO|nr:hypothetical protein Vretifemale_18950 [Volvox reticuliferus]
MKPFSPGLVPLSSSRVRQRDEYTQTRRQADTTRKLTGLLALGGGGGGGDGGDGTRAFGTGGGGAGGGGGVVTYAQVKFVAVKMYGSGARLSAAICIAASHAPLENEVESDIPSTAPNVAVTVQYQEGGGWVPL